MIRLAILSFWHVHAETFILDVRANPHAQLVAAWDENTKRGAERAAEFGLEFGADLSSLLAREDIDGVIVQTPTSMHLEVIKQAAAAGKHVFSDKVLAPTAAQAQAIVAACDLAGVVLFTGMGMFAHDYITQIKHIIDSGVLGKIVSIRMMSGHGRALLDDLPPGFYRRAEAVGGVLMDICHPIYLTPFLLGMPKTVYARFAHVTRRELEDNAAVLMDFEDGAHVSVHVTFVNRAIPAMQIEVNGTEGSVFFRSGSASLEGGPSPGTVFEKRIGQSSNIIPIPLGKSPAPTVAPWVQHIIAGTRPDANIDYAVKLSTIAEAAYESAAKDKPISLGSEPR